MAFVCIVLFMCIAYLFAIAVLAFSTMRVQKSRKCKDCAHFDARYGYCWAKVSGVKIDDNKPVCGLFVERNNAGRAE